MGNELGGLPHFKHFNLKAARKAAGESEKRAISVATEIIWGRLLEMFIQLSAIAFISLGIIASWFTTGHPEGNEAWQLPMFTICYNLSYGYLASYIFYIVNCYLPEKQQREKNYQKFAWAMARIHFNFSELSRAYGITFQFNNLEEELVKIKNDSVPIYALFFTEGCHQLIGKIIDPTSTISEEKKNQFNEFIESIKQDTFYNPEKLTLNTPFLSGILILQGTARLLSEVSIYRNELPFNDQVAINNILSLIGTEFSTKSSLTLLKSPPNISTEDLLIILVELKRRIDFLSNSKELAATLKKYKTEHEQHVFNINKMNLDGLLSLSTPLFTYKEQSPAA